MDIIYNIKKTMVSKSFNLKCNNNTNVNTGIFFCNNIVDELRVQENFSIFIHKNLPLRHCVFPVRSLLNDRRNLINILMVPFLTVLSRLNKNRKTKLRSYCKKRKGTSYTSLKNRQFVDNGRFFNSSVRNAINWPACSGLKFKKCLSNSAP